MNAEHEENIASQNEPAPAPTRSALPSKNLPFGMDWWELAAVVLSFILIAFVAIPGYFRYLDNVRGKESSARLTLIANCLKYLADQNHTQPGEKICELFDLNETLELAQRHIYTKMNIDAERALFLKLGAEPDCPGGGDYVVNLYLKADGSIPEPTCTLAFGSKRDYYLKHGLYIADMSKVDGNIGLKQPS
ncbi:MAG: hypothetical protein JXR73_09865 [Candidatus Omnitrophica bacterium]|nr:hypothetical protein [Candidatus Omnitrophota bacterium]